jgi:N-acetylmuramoyl-L-alanine amidase CwlA
MIHSVGCPQPSAAVFVKNWNVPKPNGQVCVHGFIDGGTGDIYQTLPWNWRGWHCGSGANGSGNNTHIGVEMCEPATIKYTSGANFTDSNPENTKAVVMRTYKAAVELFAKLCNDFKLDPLADGVVISHKEGCSRGIASNHGDPEHLWGKFGLTMVQFRKDIKAAMTSTYTPTPTPEPPAVSDWANDAWEWAKENGICDGTRPKDTMTREEAVTLIYRLHNLK